MASRGKQGNRNSQGDFMLVDEEGREDIDFPPDAIVLVDLRVFRVF